VEVAGCVVILVFRMALSKTMNAKVSADISANEFEGAKGVYVLILAALLLLNGCMVRSESDVLGKYELKVGTSEIALEILPDKSFSEKIVWKNGNSINRSGKWSWANNGISLDQLWIPSEFAPDYILQADASASTNGQPKYTEPGHWFIGPEKHWGTITLSVFPDADIDFKMVSHAFR
jgi:hypothetical protein